MLRKFSSSICVGMIFVLFIIITPVKASDAVLPSEVFTAIMLKALNYDRNIDRIAKDKIVIGIVSFSDDAAAQDFSSQVKDNIIKVQSSFTLKDKSIDVQSFVINGAFDKPKLEDELKQANVSILVVALNDEASISSILEITKELQINSIGENPGQAQKGVGLEIIQTDDKPHMLVNLNSIKQEGSDYDSKFLSMCEVVK